MNKQVTKDEWVAMFRDVGLQPAQMQRWHQLFETRHPEAHQAFLEWLGIAPNEIDQIRGRSQ